VIWRACAKSSVIPHQALEKILVDLAANKQDGAPSDALVPNAGKLLVHSWQGTGRSWAATIGWSHNRRKPAFIVKFIASGTNLAERAKRAEWEFDLLRRASHYFTAYHDLMVPRPIALYTDAAAIVMTYCDGICLTRFLSRARMLCATEHRRQGYENAVIACARWLRAAGSIPIGAVDIDSLRREHVRAMSARLDLARSHHLLPEVTITRLYERYVTDCDAIPWDSLDVGFVHHDFGSHNILVTNEGLCVIDMGDARFDFLLQDVSRLWLELSVIAASRSLPADQRFSIELRNQFLDACNPGVPEHSFGLFATNAALARLLNGRLLKPQIWKRWRHQLAHFLAGWLNDHALTGSLT
jgi:aminoglycoside phosphotransferase (APT) family kinase protein